MISVVNGSLQSNIEKNQLPDPTIIESIISLAEIGHLSGLKAKLDEVEAQGLAGEYFIAKMKNLASSVKFDSIIRMLRQ